MIDRELIRVVAKRLGWRELKEFRSGYAGVPPPHATHLYDKIGDGTPKLQYSPKGFLLRRIPNWLTSRDAAQVVVETLVKLKERHDYVVILQDIVERDNSQKDYTGTFWLIEWFMMGASAKQRIEAYAKVCEKEENG